MASSESEVTVGSTLISGGRQVSQGLGHVSQVNEGSEVREVREGSQVSALPSPGDPGRKTRQVPSDGTAVVLDDSNLKPFEAQLKDRFNAYLEKRRVITSDLTGPNRLLQFASAHKFFGFHRELNKWVYREYLGEAKDARLIGEFNEWNRDASPLTSHTHSVYGAYWGIELDDKEGRPVLWHKCKVKVSVLGADDEWRDRVSPWITVAWEASDTNAYDGVIWHPSGNESYVFQHDRPRIAASVTHLTHQSERESEMSGVRSEVSEMGEEGVCSPASLRVYEAHIGTSADGGDETNPIGTFLHFKKRVLPRVKRLGYNTVLLVGLQEHGSYSTFGWHVSFPFALSSRFGTPSEFKEMVDAAHGLGLRVIISLIHSHHSPEQPNSLDLLDGTYAMLLRTPTSDCDGTNRQWDARLFDLESTHTLRYLLSNLHFWIDEYKLDGVRLEGITSLSYVHRGVTKQKFDESDYSHYFSFEVEESGIVYLMLANEVIQTYGGLTPVPQLTETGEVSGKVIEVDAVTGEPMATVEIRSDAVRLISIANDKSSIPTLCRPLALGGIGFDYRMTATMPDKILEMLLVPDEEIDLSAMVTSLIYNRRPMEKLLSCVECSDTSLFGRRPLKIAMFAWESLHTHSVGGVAPHVTELAAGMARLGHEVHVFVRSRGSLAVQAVHYNVHYHECPFNLDRNFVKEMENMCSSFTHFLYESEMVMKRKFDITHAHDWLACQAGINSKNSGHVFIQTIHSTEFGRCGNQAFGGSSADITALERTASHLADRVICVSGVLADEVSSRFGVHRDKIKVIYNGIHCDQFDALNVDAGAVKAGMGIGMMDPLFLFVGRMVMQKSPDVLLQAIPHVLKMRGDAKFVFVGDGHMLNEMKTTADRLGVAHAVRFLGAKGGAEVRSLFLASDAVVVPSRNEPFGIVVLEAWAARKPVLATTSGGPRDFVTPGVDGYLVDPNPGSVAWGCCEVLNNFSHAEWMGERGRVKAAFNFSWDSIATETRGVYYEQLNRHDAPYCQGDLGDGSLASRLIGAPMFTSMKVFDENDTVTRGLALHKMIRLLVMGLGGEAYLNFMGNEFAHPGCLDLPRPSNQMSHANAGRRWDLSDNKNLKFKNFELFEAVALQWESELRWMSPQAPQFVVKVDNEDKVVAFERGPCLFIFNFHPTKSFEGYQVGWQQRNKSLVAFDTDEGRFGGYDRLTTGHDTPFPALSGCDGRSHSVKVYLPCRTAMVLISKSAAKTIRSFCNDLPDWLNTTSPDLYIDSLPTEALSHAHE
eukprot:GHVN01094347.1.p1 GENE.GHVN01094347.1~~GHVN01094347.1.p1  ORF type:complete len:1269 (-),score=245.04 GHVN01094347.1:175-3981(-)